MTSASPASPGESSRQFERLLRGEVTPKQYVQALRDEARSNVASQRTASSGAKRVAAA